MTTQADGGIPPRMPDPSPKQGSRRWLVAALFLYLWLMVGFASGTATLLGPTRWVKSALDRTGLAAYESQAMWVVILLFVVGSFVLARWLHGQVVRSQRGVVRAGIPLTATALAAIALAGWSDPAALAGLAGARQERVALESGAEFVFGPYPDRPRLEQLKRDGFTAVISLQHPAVVPIEPQGIEAERRTAAELGIEFIHAPMLPWVSDNDESLALVQEIAREGTGRYYVHCGLGRDRVNIVKAMIERMGTARVEVTADLKPARTFADRVAERRFLMERGNFQVLGDQVWLVPWPNPQEGYGKLLAGQVAQVTVLMDPAEPEQAGWMEEARALFGTYAIPVRIHPFRGDDERALDELARSVRSGPRPAVVMVPRTRPCLETRVADAFLQAWERAGGPPLDGVVPGDGDPAAEGRPLPCERA